MYATSVFYNQIYSSLFPARQSSSYGNYFLIRQVYTRPASGRPLGSTDGNSYESQTTGATSSARFTGSESELDFYTRYTGLCGETYE
jgi:hypothetical protein